MSAEHSDTEIPIPIPGLDNTDDRIAPKLESKPTSAKYPEMEPLPSDGKPSAARAEEKAKSPKSKSPKLKPKATLYNYDASPPDFNLAKIHGKATRVYAQLPPNYKPNRPKVCECCGNMYELGKLPLCCAKSDMYHLGIGFPLYFEFIVFSIIMLFIVMLVMGIYHWVTNWLSNDCGNNLLMTRDDREFCDYGYINQMSLLNKRFQANFLSIGEWLNLASVIVMIIAFQIYKRQSRLTIQEGDNSQQTPADFTIVISNLPTDAKDDEIKEFFDNHVFKDRRVDIVKIVRGYDISEFVKLSRQKVALKNKLASKKEIPNRKKLEEEFEDITKKLQTIESNHTKHLEYSTYAYITFEKEEQAKRALKRLGFRTFFRKLAYYLGCYSCFNDTRFRGKIKLRAQRAPEPSDILWENLGVPEKEKNKRRAISLIVSILGILACFGIITGFNVLKAKTTQSDNTTTKQQFSTTVGTEVISIVIACLILIVNTVLVISTRKFAMYESHSTFTDYFVSVARRIAVSTFINSAFTILITCYAVKNLWKSSGLTNQVFTNFIVTAVVTPLANLFDPTFFLKLYQRSSAIKQGKNSTLTQKEANILFEGPPIDMAQCYADVLKAVWIAAFFAPLQPIGLPITFVGLGLLYWSDKYLLLKRYVKPLELGKGLSVWMMEYLEFTPFIFAAGNFIFRTLILVDNYQYEYPSKLAAIIQIAIAAGSLFIPFDSLLGCWGKGDNGGYQEYTYSKLRVNFNNDYDISNPIYHDQALEDWLKEIDKVDKDRADALRDIIDENNEQNGFNGNASTMGHLRQYANNGRGLEAIHNHNDRPMMQLNQNPVQMYQQINPYQMQQPVMLNTFGTLNQSQSLNNMMMQNPNNMYSNQTGFYGGTNSAVPVLNANQNDPYNDILKPQNQPIPRPDQLPPLQRGPTDPQYPMNNSAGYSMYPYGNQNTGNMGNMNPYGNQNMGYSNQQQFYPNNQGGMMMGNNQGGMINNNNFQNNDQILTRNNNNVNAGGYNNSNTNNFRQSVAAQNNPNVNINFSNANYGAPQQGYRR